MSETPLKNEGIDVYIKPVSFCKEISVKNQQDVQIPTIFYGNSSFLRKAFLGGCVDYLKDPWTVEELEIRLTKILKSIKKKYDFPWGCISFAGTDVITEQGRCSLSYHEYILLHALIRQRGKVVPREVLFSH